MLLLTACCWLATISKLADPPPSIVGSLPESDRFKTFYKQANQKGKIFFSPAENKGGDESAAADVIAPLLTPFVQARHGALTVITKDAGQRPLAGKLVPTDLITSTMFGLRSAARSFAARYEALAEQERPSFANELLAVRDEASPTSMERMLHLYVSGPNGSALPPHTDPHDAYILGVYGTKRWSVCTPGGGDSAHLPRPLRTKLVHRCANLEPEDIALHLSCKEYTVRAGDLLYLPAVHLHWAIAQESGSAHLTLGSVTDESRGSEGLAATARLQRLAECALVRPGYVLEAIGQKGRESYALRALLCGSLMLFLWWSNRPQALPAQSQKADKRD